MSAVQPAADTCSPAEIANRICLWSCAKCTIPLDRLVPLGLLGGLYIGLGGALATLATSESAMGAGPTRWLGGVAFSLGLLLVVIGGAELSTGNCLMVIARMRGSVTSRDLWRNWSLSYVTNAGGALALTGLIVGSGIYDTEPMHSAAIRIAEAKLALAAPQAFLRGILANTLVCLAVWLAMSSLNMIGKFIGIVLPISAFVALGFEHSIANFYLIPAGLMVGAKGAIGDLVCNLIAVTAGNLVGGAVVAAGMLWLSHGREGK